MTGKTHEPPFQKQLRMEVLFKGIQPHLMRPGRL